MSTPTQRHSRHRKGSRRSHHALKPIQVAFDADGNPHLPHHSTPKTGKYRGRTVIDTLKRVTKRAKKKS